MEKHFKVYQKLLDKQVKDRELNLIKLGKIHVDEVTKQFKNWGWSREDKTIRYVKEKISTFTISVDFKKTYNNKVITIKYRNELEHSNNFEKLPFVYENKIIHNKKYQPNWIDNDYGDWRELNWLYILFNEIGYFTWKKKHTLNNPLNVVMRNIDRFYNHITKYYGKN